MIKHIVSNSNDVSLHFLVEDEEDWYLYKQAEKNLNMSFFLRLRLKHGYWAGSQNCYVDSKDKFNFFDSLYDESLLASYLTKNIKESSIISDDLCIVEESVAKIQRLLDEASDIAIIESLRHLIQEELDTLTGQLEEQ